MWGCCGRAGPAAASMSCAQKFRARKQAAALQRERVYLAVLNAHCFSCTTTNAGRKVLYEVGLPASGWGFVE
jgi:hypothetical protein